MASQALASAAGDYDTEVLIIGAGPVGLGMAIELGQRNVSTMLVDQGDGTIEHPRTGLIAVRTMELARKWGLAEEIRNAGFPEDYELSIFFCTSLNGHVLAKAPYPSQGQTPTPPETPEKKQRCPQSWMQPVLLKAAAAQPRNDMRLLHRFETFSQDENGVSAQICDLSTGKSISVRAKYLLACDGAASQIREALAIRQQGRLLSYSVNILIDAPDLIKYHPLGEAERYLFVGPEGTWGNLTVIDGADSWRLTVLGSEEKMNLESFDADLWVRRAFGRDDVPYKITSVVPWRRSEMLAERFVDGRVILAGDAIHTTSPTGGMGMNTGMQEVWDLGWKIEALLNGWGGPRLMESYLIERHPVAARNLAFSTGNFNAWKDVPDTAIINDDTPEAAALRQQVGEVMRDSTRVEWESLGLQIGHRYEGSPIIVPDGTPAYADDFSLYVPTSRPGSRAPHAWLSPGRSTLDLFGAGFVLLDFGTDQTAAQPLLAALQQANVPHRHEPLTNPQIASLYERALVLVRPDGHVAWRGDKVVDAAAIVETIRGAA